MGKITPTYRVEYRDNHLAFGIVGADAISRVDRRAVHVMAWDGRPSDAALDAWRRDLNGSFAAGGANAHLATALGSVPHVYWARIVRQSTNEVVAETAAPAFEAA